MSIHESLKGHVGVGLMAAVCLTSLCLVHAAAVAQGVEQDSTLPLKLQIAKTDSRVETAWITVDDVEGTYTVPYLQSGRDLALEFSFDNPLVTSASVVLRREGVRPIRQTVRPPCFGVCFKNLRPGEYTVRVRGFRADGQQLCRGEYARLGIGIVAAAIGDSITEGYFGNGFMQGELHRRAEQFPPDSVSRDGRNFPQFAPTAHQHLPSVNCFESWMTQLNDALNETWKQPVFIANEGWGGITSAGYLQMMRSDEEWRDRIARLRPQVWLIHLGVNDERAQIPAPEFAANMSQIVDVLIREFGATHSGIFIANPCYDYFEGASGILGQYCDELDRVIFKRGLRKGPDFFSIYASDRKRWYGEDPVHPNVEGMKRMAETWHDALVAASPNGPRR